MVEKIIIKALGFFKPRNSYCSKIMLYIIKKFILVDFGVSGTIKVT